MTELFAIQRLSSQARAERFELLPKTLDANYDSVIVSFLNDKLLGLRLVDVLGQTTEVIFSSTQNNPPISSDEFKVNIPEGFDVIQG